MELAIIITLSLILFAAYFYSLNVFLDKLQNNILLIFFFLLSIFGLFFGVKGIYVLGDHFSIASQTMTTLGTCALVTAAATMIYNRLTKRRSKDKDK